ncbi:hypothetical protein B0H13DRAFT_2533268, partial [Mycena leptocephala]
INDALLLQPPICARPLTLWLQQRRQQRRCPVRLLHPLIKSKRSNRVPKRYHIKTRRRSVSFPPPIMSSRPKLYRPHKNPPQTPQDHKDHPQSSPLVERTQHRHKASDPYPYVPYSTLRPHTNPNDSSHKQPTRICICPASNPDSDIDSSAPPPPFSLAIHKRPPSVAYSEPNPTHHQHRPAHYRSRSPAISDSALAHRPERPAHHQRSVDPHRPRLLPHLPAPHPNRDQLDDWRAHAHQHSGSLPPSTTASARGRDDAIQDRRGGQGGGSARTSPARSAPGGSAQGGDDGAHHGHDGEHSTGDDGSPTPLDYGGLSDSYDDAANHPQLIPTGPLQATRNHDLTFAFNTVILPYFLGRCSPCAVRGLEHDHLLDDCTAGFGCSDNDPAYRAWHHKALTLPKRWCTYCLMALPSAGGWHDDDFGTRCPFCQIFKPALWTLFTHHEPAPHISTSDLVSPALFEDPVPGLYALCEWAQTPVKAQPGLLNLHVLLLWLFDFIGIVQIPESCRPLVTELAARTDAQRANAPWPATT